MHDGWYSQRGHYYAYLKPHVRNMWYKFDDDRVQPVPSKEVYDNNFGGIIPGSSAISTTTAYLLMYLRDDDIPILLEPVTDADVPDHVKQQ